MIAGSTSPTYPALYRSFDSCSARFQSRFTILTRISLIGTVVAAAGGTVSISGEIDWPAVVALLAFVVAGGSRLVLLQERPERAWYDSRAGAESVKTLAWQYAVGGGAFALSTGEGGASTQRLIERFRELVRSAHRLVDPPTPDEYQVTPWMAELRAGDLLRRRGAYLEHRLGDQIRWYGSSAERHDRLARRWALATMAFQGVGALGAVLRVVGAIDVDLLGIAAAAAAASTAWLESRDHSGLAEAYGTTAHELALARDDLPRELDEQRWSVFVGDTEAAISREHTSWLARRRALTARNQPR